MRGRLIRATSVALGTVLVVLSFHRGSAAATSSHLPVPPGYSRTDLLFSDTFDGNQLDPGHWVPFIASRASAGLPWNSNGQGGSGLSSPDSYSNQEYDVPSQVQVHGGLVIHAVRQPTEGLLGSQTRLFSWRSGIISTYQHFEFTGGYVQVEAKVPAAPGIWPAIWLLPGPSAQSMDGYEIDLFEGGYRPPTGTADQSYAWYLHTPSAVVGTAMDAETNLSRDYHLFGLRWDPGRSLTWYLDGHVMAKVTSRQASIPDQPMELVLDLGVAAPATSRFHTLPDRATPPSANLDVRAVQVYG